MSIDRAHRRVIFASSLGTVFEWFDFYLYGTLAVFFGTLFFPPGNDTAAFLASLATFGAGFAVRPLGALVFGRLGDLIGRKYTFLITIVVMGLATALVGVLPTYAQVGIWAPVLLVTLRLAQGLALGGEYGGAATYVAEHAPPAQRGYYTSWIQTTATLGFFLSLAVILGCRVGFGEEAFREWGWRVPFLLSVILLGISVYIRLKLAESPLFVEMKAEGTRSRAPLTESFGQWRNLKVVLLALFGATCGQGVVWYTGQFYALFFLQNTLKVDFGLSYMLIGVALLIGTPFFVVFGRLSDRIGRKRIIVAGLRARDADAVPDLQRSYALRESGARGVRSNAPRSPSPRAMPLQHLREAGDAVRSRARLLDEGGLELRSRRRSTVRRMSSRRSPASRSSVSMSRRTARRSNAAAIRPVRILRA